MAVDRTFMLALLAGAFIGFGALFYTLVITGSTLGFAQPACSAAWRSRSA